jgi:hypothetical protein
MSRVMRERSGGGVVEIDWCGDGYSTKDDCAGTPLVSSGGGTKKLSMVWGCGIIFSIGGFIFSCGILSSPLAN